MTAQEQLEAATPEVRAVALALLDSVSAPMHPRAIERALCESGFTRSKARPIVNVLKRLPIIAMGDGRL
jgi:hypothetical protein